MGATKVLSVMFRGCNNHTNGAGLRNGTTVAHTNGVRGHSSSSNKARPFSGNNDHDDIVLLIKFILFPNAQKMDANQDGVISVEEFMETCKSVSARMG